MSAGQSRTPAEIQVHLFCRVIDNHGDAGVCWRLARQLAREYGASVALVIDQPEALQPLLAANECETLPGIQVHDWQQVAGSHAKLPVPDLVIEAFACELPTVCLQSMQQQQKAPCWINLEYLSAEDWVTGCHGLDSMHPQTGLTKTFFFPGFTPATGGLLRERGLISQHQQWQADAEAREKLFAEAGMTCPAGPENALLISLFTYETAAVTGLIETLSAVSQPVLCLIPEGRVPRSLGLPVGSSRQAGALTLQVIPFQSQQGYDRLLSLCDLNLVRGEDSFVRAQWAGKPLLWHIYEQADGAHLPKLEAFLALYIKGMPAQLATRVSTLWQDWNRGHAEAELWQFVLEKLPEWHRHARGWREKMSEQKDLASNLMNFYENRL